VELLTAVWLVVTAFVGSSLILGTLIAVFGSPADPYPLEDDDVEVD
jgi:hypothetical protein